MNRVRISPGRGGVNVYANHRRTYEDAPDLHGAGGSWGGGGVCPDSVTLGRSQPCVQMDALLGECGSHDRPSLTPTHLRSPN